MLLGLPAKAVTIDSVSGASATDLESTTTTPIIYGGTAGRNGGATDHTDCNNGTTTTTCDSCTNKTGRETCNKTGIHVSLQLTISFTSDIDCTTGSCTAMIAPESSGTPVTTISNSSGVSNGDSAEITVLWETLCSAMDTSTPASGCNTNFSLTARLGVDADQDGTLEDSESSNINITVQDPALAMGGLNNADEIDFCTSSSPGVCQFTAYAGDEKIYIEDLDSGTGFPVLANLSFSHVRVFYSDTSQAAANPGQATNAASPTDLKIDTNSDGSFDLTNNIVDGLTNGTEYFVRVAMVDPAGNVAFITSDNAFTSECTSVDSDNCRFVDTPSEVFGLLSEDLNCFITTVAYGSSWAPEVKTFREFRNRFLVPKDWGRKVIKTYYNIGPKMARWVNDKESIKAVFRVLLWPLWLFAWLSLKIGAFFTCLLFATGICLPILISKAYTSMKQQRALYENP